MKFSLFRHRSKRGKNSFHLIGKFIFAGISLVIGFLASIFITGINIFSAQVVPPIFPEGSEKCDTGLLGNPCNDSQMNTSGPQDLLTKTWILSEALPWWISYFLGLAAGVAVIMFMGGGILILTAGENSERRGKGVKAITWALIGLLIAMFAFVIVAIIENIPFPGTTE
ncbi:hypothetical protein HZA38_00430 [Candidatus Peregrinibacteria bacterium]|nr:hypothetical protein [Candidatus Peregrinibacteria bacterium]